MYGGSSHNLYTIDMETGKATLVGPFQLQGPSMISMDCDSDGIMYAYDLNFAQSKLYTIDLGTGKATPIGNTGISLMYGQDMAYDSGLENMYACVFNYNSWTPEFCEVNLETGKFTTLSQMNNQITCFAIPGSCPPPTVYIKKGLQEIEVVVENLGTFPETDMNCSVQIYEYITNCTNGTLVYEDYIDNIDILEPLVGSVNLSFEKFNFTEEGPYLIKITLTDDDDDYLCNNGLKNEIIVDETSPVSDHELDPEYPNGEDGFYINDVEVFLSAFDPELVCDISGCWVKEIRYSINGVGGVIPGDSGSFDITEDGKNIEVVYWAIDHLENTEEKKSFSVDVDQTQPAVDEVVWESNRKGTNWFIKFSCYAEDETSGMEKVEMYINDGLVDTIISPGPEYDFEIQWSPILNKCNFKFVHYDRAGLYNEVEIQGSDIQTFSIMEFESIIQKLNMKYNIS
jgi:hypothetical protein